MAEHHSAFQRYPVTIATLTVIVFLFVAVTECNQQKRDTLGGLHHYGAVSRLVISTEPKLNGPFQLWGTRWWQGEWWRMGISGFHHAGLFHLICNSWMLVYLGRLLEPRIGSFRCGVFLLSGTLVSLLPCFVMEHSVVGLSGGLYAMFGLLVMMRQYDDDLLERLPSRLVVAGFLWIPIGLFVNATGLMRISNLGHAGGLIYGLIAGCVYFPLPQWRRRVSARWFLVGHLLIIPAAFFATHPEWNARYHWYRGWRAEGEEKRSRLQRAVQLDPQLGGAWRMLADDVQRDGDSRLAWQTLFDGIGHNPADRKLQNLAAHWYRRSATDDRLTALQLLRERFPRRHSVWRINLGLLNPPIVPPYQPPTRLDYLSAKDGPPRPDIPRGPNLFWSPVDEELKTRSRPQTAPPVDPDKADSALFGTPL